MSRTNKDSKWGRKKLGYEEWAMSVPSWFKKENRQNRRAQEKQAVREHKDPPKFRKTDTWDWW